MIQTRKKYPRNNIVNLPGRAITTGVIVTFGRLNIHSLPSPSTDQSETHLPSPGLSGQAFYVSGPKKPAYQYTRDPAFMHSGVTLMDNPRIVARVIIQEATAQLRKAGYYAFRVTNPELSVKLIACARNRVFFIVVKRCRKFTITNHAGTVKELINLVNSGTVPGDVYLWLYRSYSWSRHQILPGGAIQTEGLI